MNTSLVRAWKKNFVGFFSLDCHLFQNYVWDPFCAELKHLDVYTTERLQLPGEAQGGSHCFCGCHFPSHHSRGSPLCSNTNCPRGGSRWMFSGKLIQSETFFLQLIFCSFSVTTVTNPEQRTRLLILHLEHFNSSWAHKELSSLHS